MVAVGEMISDWGLGRGQQPRLYGGGSHTQRAESAGTVPLVNNLFQGMANDPVTALY